MLIQLRDLRLAYGTQPLFDAADIALAAGERVALVGRNGSGKSTLIRVISGEIEADSAIIDSKDGLRVARLEQQVPPDLNGPAYDLVAAGLGDAGAALARFHEISQRLARGEAVMAAFDRAQAAVEATGGWTLGPRVEATLSRLGLDPDKRFEALSGGQKRRVLLARALVSEPDLLLLDEPTNHLDIAAIAQLEEILLAWPGALLFITHDRAFLRRLATRIVDLDRGKLVSYPGDYDRFVATKAKALEDEDKANALFDKRLAQEEVWIRQGIKARRTRNEGRVRALEAMRAQRRQRRSPQGGAKLVTQNALRSGRDVVVAEQISYRWGEQSVIEHLSTLIQRGDKVGIIGPNGCGKTTLIRLLLGELAPERGSIRLGTNLTIAHFDQHRAALNEDVSVQDNVGQGRSSIEVNGRQQHVLSYLQDFLFSPRRARSPTRVLSGGERNRLLLAKLFTQPANLLVMDEPTNDLDVETLELLEERLVQFNGSLLLVSHDRAFLDNIVTSTLVFEGAGRVNEYVGGYSDWLRQRPAPAAPVKRGKADPRPARAPSPLATSERKELRALPGRIEAIEARITDLEAAFAQPGFYDPDASRGLAAVRSELETAMARWETLESRYAL